jgi:hypothetical protein
MVVRVTDIQEGMHVYGSDGEELGNVAEVYPMTSTNCFKVDQGGFLGIAVKELYVPLDAVQTADPASGVILSCTKEEADVLFEEKPGDLNQIS